MLLSVLETLALCEWRLDVVTAAAAVMDLAIDASSISCFWIGESCYAIMTKKTLPKPKLCAMVVNSE